MTQKATSLQLWRSEIDQLDLELIAILAKRMEKVREIGQFKKTNNLPALNRKRRQTVISQWQKEAGKHALSEEFIKEIYELIHSHALTIEAQC
jgi:chorismate mutase